MHPTRDHGSSRHRVTIDGDPSLDLALDQGAASGSWTAYAGLTAIPALCAAAPGFTTHLDLGTVRPQGLIP